MDKKVLLALKCRTGGIISACLFQILHPYNLAFILSLFLWTGCIHRKVKAPPKPPSVPQEALWYGFLYVPASAACGCRKVPYGDILRLRYPFHGSTVIFIHLNSLSHATRRRSERIGQGHAVHAGDQRSATRHTRLLVLLPLTGTARLNIRHRRPGTGRVPTSYICTQSNN